MPGGPFDDETIGLHRLKLFKSEILHCYYRETDRMKVKAVLFDLGKTLVKPWTPELVLKRILFSLGIDRPLDEIRGALVKADDQFGLLNYRSSYGKVPYREYWDKWDSLVLSYLGVPGHEWLLREIEARWFDHIDCEVYPEVRVTLSKLRESGLKTGLISTGYEVDIYNVLEKVNLPKEFFDIIIGADTIKKVKPHPEVFRYALRRLGVKPEEALFVGDQIDVDYRGAEEVGITSVLIQRTNSDLGEVSGLRVIKSLEEVFQFI